MIWSKLWDYRRRLCRLDSIKIYCILRRCHRSTPWKLCVSVCVFFYHSFHPMEMEMNGWEMRQTIFPRQLQRWLMFHSNFLYSDWPTAVICGSAWVCVCMATDWQMQMSYETTERNTFFPEKHYKNIQYYFCWFRRIVHRQLDTGNLPADNRTSIFGRFHDVQHDSHAPKTHCKSMTKAKEARLYYSICRRNYMRPICAFRCIEWYIYTFEYKPNGRNM